VLPEWRDDALLNLKQVLKDSKQEIAMKVDMQTDPAQFKMTSLGRKAAVADVVIDRKNPLKTVPINTDEVQNEAPAYGFANTRGGCELTILPEDIILEDSLDENSSELELNNDDESIILTVQVPQQTNLSCNIAGIGNINIQSKLEGDVSLCTHKGDIIAKQLRGYHIDIQTNDGNIISSKNIEAQTIQFHIKQTGSLNAKMVNGSDINISVPLQKTKMEDKDSESSNTTALVDISSLYTSHTGEGASIQMVAPLDNVDFTKTPKHVRVKSHHGHIAINTVHPPSSIDPKIDKFGNPMPLVELGGMNGSCDVLVQSNDYDEVDSTANRENHQNNFIAARVHIDSLAPNTMSVLTANKGDVGLTIDRKVDTDLCLVSSPYISTLNIDDVLEAENGDALHESLCALDSEISTQLGTTESTSVYSKKRIHIDTNSFIQSAPANTSNPFAYVQYAYGEVSNQSQEPDSRFDVQTKGISSKRGKIDVESAALQALHGFTKQDPLAQAKNAETSSLENKNQNGRSYEWPYLGATTSGNIKVETVNWLGAIARRYGMDEVHRDRENLGRQAKKSVK